MMPLFLDKFQFPCFLISQWIPDGQLCPTVPNRSNYIHWIEDLLASDIIPKTNTSGGNVRGFDIGTGANCIYPLLGASLLGWSFVGSDVTEIALEWAEQNVKNNPHISQLIEIRKVKSCEDGPSMEKSHDGESVSCESKIELSACVVREDVHLLPSASFDLHSDANKRYNGPPVLLDVIRDGEKFDFCMCNPPFFETMEEAGLNPKTSCGGTPEEMICPGGEKAFITRIIEDSAVLKQSFRWYTSMVGRKSNVKSLTAKLWEVGVTIVKTTEFVQGQTCRWGLAWSFVPPVRKIVSLHVAEKNVMSFMLEMLLSCITHFSLMLHLVLCCFQFRRVFNANSVPFIYCNQLNPVESLFRSSGAACKLNTSSFTVDITASNDHCDAILKNELQPLDEVSSCQHVQETLNGSSCLLHPSNNLCIRISVFQQIPGTLLVKGSLQQRDNPIPGNYQSFAKVL
uniref:U6 small nuclear RNA (adenine-(43)-N(6))-methyltransferase n=1 Tax=Quercus lobata TaxID=97700 RepID=A0A7N2MYC5_QUELO